MIGGAPVLGDLPPKPESVDSLTVLTTAGCNLDCPYCYRRGGGPGSLRWRELAAALDWAWKSALGDLDVVFTGGEPLLRYDLVEKALLRIWGWNPGERRINVRLLTNGLLLDEEKTRFLIDHDVFVNLSCDGTSAAQDQRSAGTWSQIDRTLDFMADADPGWFGSRLQVTMTLTPRNLSLLADSTAYMMDKGVESIAISPALSSVPEWDKDLEQVMEEQLSAVFSRSLRCFKETGRVPFLPFRRYQSEVRPREHHPRTCAALNGRNPALDVDGRLYSCLMFVPSGVDPADDRLGEISADLSLGRVGDPDLEDHRRGFPAGIRNKEVFTSAPDLRSRYGGCEDCPAVRVCKICPLTLLEFTPGKSPRRVPAFLCAWYRLSFDFNRKFPVQPRPESPEVTMSSIKAGMEYWATPHQERSPEAQAPGDPPSP